MIIVGELINGMYKEVREALAKKDKKVIQDLAKRQIEAGASILDVNCGPASRDPIADMKWLVETIQETNNVSLSLDSTKPDVIEAGLKLVKNKPMINSTSADPDRLEVLVGLAIKYKAFLIGLALDKRGVPQDKDRRLELAAQIIGFCQEKGFPTEDLYLDPVVLPVNVAQTQQVSMLEALREFKLLSDPAPKTIIGLSNVSQGAKDRSIINRIFLVMSLSNGLDAAILDPLDKALMDSFITAELILNKQIYCDSYLDAYKKR
ncbi:MAG: dihydropteroate synthase [Candidatus Omnitrophota bacterium]